MSMDNTPRGLSSCSHDSCCFSNWLFPLIRWFWFRCLNQVRDNVKKALKLRWTSAQCHNATMPSSWTRLVRVSCLYHVFRCFQMFLLHTLRSLRCPPYMKLATGMTSRLDASRTLASHWTFNIIQQAEQLEQLDCSSQITLSVTIYKNHQANLMINYQQITTDHNRS